jgi:hypothetical protein
MDRVNGTVPVDGNPMKAYRDFDQNCGNLEFQSHILDIMMDLPHSISTTVQQRHMTSTASAHSALRPRTQKHDGVASASFICHQRNYYWVHH